MVDTSRGTGLYTIQFNERWQGIWDNRSTEIQIESLGCWFFVLSFCNTLGSFVERQTDALAARITRALLLKHLENTKLIVL